MDDGTDKASARHLIVIYSLRGGGAERTLINLLHRLGPDAKEVKLLIGVGGGVLEAEVPACVQREWLFRSSFLARVCFWLFRKRIFRAPLKLAWRAKNRQQYSSAVSFLDSFLTDLVVESCRAEKKVTVVHSDFESNPNYQFGKLNKARREFLRKHRYLPLDTIAFVSRSALDAFERTIGRLDNFEILPILFSPEEIRLRSDQPVELVSKPPGPAADDAKAQKVFHFVCIGSLLPVKGHDLLLDACELLAKGGYQFHLHIVGDGPRKDALLDQVGRLGLDPFVTLHGFMKNPYPILAASDCLVLPSVSEAMPTVICEAHALGVPVMASDCEGCRNLLEGGEFGLIFGRKKAVLAESMISFIESAELRADLRRKGQLWLESYDTDEVLQRYHKLIGLAEDSGSARLPAESGVAT